MLEGVCKTVATSNGFACCSSCCVIVLVRVCVISAARNVEQRLCNHLTLTMHMPHRSNSGRSAAAQDSQDSQDTQDPVDPWAYA